MMFLKDVLEKLRKKNTKLPSMQKGMTFEGHVLGMKQCHFHQFLDRKEKCGMELQDVDAKRCESMVDNFLVGAIEKR